MDIFADLLQFIINLCVLLFSTLQREQNSIEWLSRVDCAPKPGITRDNCTRLGCIWEVVDPNPANVPWCYFPRETGYTLSAEDDTYAAEGSLKLKRLETGATNPYGEDFPELLVKVSPMGKALTVEIAPVGGGRFVPPVPLNMSAVVESDEELVFKYEKSATDSSRLFSFTVERKSDGCRVWDTSIGGLLFADQYIQIATYLPTDRVFGFGEHVHHELKHDFTKYTTWGMFARDSLPDSQKLAGVNYYGVHPFYLALEPSGKAHGVLIFNFNAQDVTTGPGPHLIYRTIGGQLNLYFFPGPTPEQVVQQYQQLIGKPILPPYWALGYQFCRYTYKSLGDMAATIKRIRDARIPIDVAQTDIDYMDRFKDFTYSMENWASLPNYTNQLHEWGMRHILIFDPPIQVIYEPFQRAIAANASFIEWPNFDIVPHDVQDMYPLVKDTKIMLGVAWPDNHIVFPDFLDPTSRTSQWWTDEIARFHHQIAFDGMWMDMNEPSNLGTNDDHPWYNVNAAGHTSLEPLQCPLNHTAYASLESPNYATASVYQRDDDPLSTATLCMCGLSTRGTNTNYNTHSLYGWSQTVATKAALDQTLKRRAPVITRSTIPSSGRYSGHWLGDNAARWEDLRVAIIGVQEFNLFGIPYVGSDVCGFRLATNEELCLRWQQLGAFHSFFRNHNDIGVPDQDPPQWPAVALATREANLFRYRHLPYLYSLHFRASLYGGTVVRPVFFEFPTDPIASSLSHQFMWGDSIMVLPVLYPDVTEIRCYLPPSSGWYSISAAHKYGHKVQGGYSTFSAPRDTPLPTFVRAGRIIPTQGAGLTTVESRLMPFRLLVALDFDSLGLGTASGELYWDDGESLMEEPIESAYSFYHFEFSVEVNATTTTILIKCDKTPKEPITLPTLDTIEILGYGSAPKLNSAMLNGHSLVINPIDNIYLESTASNRTLKINSPSLINFNEGGSQWVISWTHHLD